MRQPLRVRIARALTLVLAVTAGLPSSSRAASGSPGARPVAQPVSEGYAASPFAIAADTSKPGWPLRALRSLSQHALEPAFTNRDFPTGRLAASSGASAADGAWQPLPPPSEREGPSAVYDPVRRRMILFGGDAYPISDNDVWVLSLDGDHEWSRLTTQGPRPGARADHTAIFDPIRDRMLVYGGLTSFNGDPLDGVWALSFATPVPTWSLLSTSGPTPSARWDHSAIYDPRRDRMIVCGGASSGSYSYGETWALSLAEPPTWSPIVPIDSLPFGRVAHVAVYDPVRDRMLILMGGDTDFRDNPDDVWALSLGDTSTWSLVATTGAPAPPAWYSAGVYDSTADRVVVWGGATSSSVLNEAWSLELVGTPHWTPLPNPAAGPSYRYRHSYVFDPVAREMVIFGGNDELGTDLGLNDCWALSLGATPTWHALPTGLSRPSRRLGASAIHDPLRHRMILFGGLDHRYAYLDDTWELSLFGSPAWAPIVPAGEPPRARAAHTAIYDPIRDRMLVFGGTGDQVYFNDLWALWLSPAPRWEKLTPLGPSPATRHAHTAVYDAQRDRMLVFAGSDGYWRADLWELTLGNTPTWHELSPAPPLPSVRGYATAILDAPRTHMIVYGGLDTQSGLSDCWSLALEGPPTWEQLAPTGIAPIGLYAHTAVLDPLRNRMIISGGQLYRRADAIWALSLGASPAWSLLSPRETGPTARQFHCALYDPDRDRMVLFGGDDLALRSDVWMLEWSPTLDAPSGPGEHPGSISLSAPRPNPSAGTFQLAFSLPDAAPARLELFDLRGRRCASREVGALGAGRHTITLGEANAQVPGVYFARLQRGGTSRVQRVVLAR